MQEAWGNQLEELDMLVNNHNCDNWHHRLGGIIHITGILVQKGQAGEKVMI